MTCKNIKFQKRSLQWSLRSWAPPEPCTACTCSWSPPCRWCQTWPAENQNTMKLFSPMNDQKTMKLSTVNWPLSDFIPKDDSNELHDSCSVKTKKISYLCGTHNCQSQLQASSASLAKQILIWGKQLAFRHHEQNFVKRGGWGQSSVDSSTSSILPPRVRLPNTPSMLLRKLSLKWDLITWAKI